MLTTTLCPKLSAKICLLFFAKRFFSSIPSTGVKIMSKNNGNTSGGSRSSTAPKKSRFPPGEMYLSVLGNGSSSSARALYLFTDGDKYLFNCGEGTQRLANEHKMKLSKLNNIFITHLSWENLGGLLGLSLTSQDMGTSEICIHGPPGLDKLYEYGSSFIYLNVLNIETKDHNSETYRDDCMEVNYIPIFKSTKVSMVQSSSSNSEGSNDSTSIEHKSKKRRLSELKALCDVTIAFACKGHNRPGHILFDKCVELGVPVGPFLGELKSGKDVTLPSGKVVLSKDVVSEDEVCPLFLVVECPSIDFLDPFVNEEKFIKYQENQDVLASLIVHFTPSEIFKTAEYQEWIQRFPSSTTHLVLNNDCSTSNSIAIHRLQHQLNILHPRMFSLLQENEGTENLNVFGDNVYHPKTLERFYLRPAKNYHRDFAIQIEPEEFIQEAMSAEGFAECNKKLQDSIKELSYVETNSELYPEVTFLGTGSCIPSKVRNVSAILLNTSEDKYILMDCGEGTHGQMLRLYGSKTSNILSNLFCVFISHLHADHHLGLITILKERQKVLKNLQKEHEPLLIVGPGKLVFWINRFFTNFDCIKPNYRFIECSELEHEQSVFTSHEPEQMFEKCPDIIVSTVPVEHCLDAHAIIVSSNKFKWKLVYSGDAMPSKQLASDGKDCLLLIHEATMEDELYLEALQKKHSTTSGAIQMGKNMNAKYTILTHFSQRYAKVPLFNENFHKGVGCAFDNMRIRPSELHILSMLIPPLNALFADHVKELQVKGSKRRQKSELVMKMISETDCIKKT